MEWQVDCLFLRITYSIYSTSLLLEVTFLQRLLDCMVTVFTILPKSGIRRRRNSNSSFYHNLVGTVHTFAIDNINRHWLLLSITFLPRFTKVPCLRNQINQQNFYTWTIKKSRPSKPRVTSPFAIIDSLTPSPLGIATARSLADSGAKKTL